MNVRFVLLFSMLSALSVHAHAAEPEETRCKYRELGSLPVSYHGTGLAVTTSGNINDTPAVMLLDTGAGDNLLTLTGIGKRGLRMSPTGEVRRGVGGESRIYDVPVRNFDVGPMKSSGRGRMRVIGETGWRAEFDAIAGAPFLLQLDLELALADKKIRFFQPENCGERFLGYWDANAVQVPLSFNKSKHPLVTVLVDGVTLTAVIDTGAGRSKVSMTSLGKLGLSPTSPGMTRAGDSSGVGSAILRNFHYRFKTFSIGSETIQNPQLIVGETLPPGIDMLLGNDFMRAHRILIASSQSKVYLSYLGGPPFDTDQSAPWIAAEAEAGNAYAQFHMAQATQASAPAASRAWMEKAAAQNNPLALRQLARLDERKGRFAEAALLRQRALDGDPFDLPAQFELFGLRVKAGQGPQAVEDLSKVVTRMGDLGWPRPIADYYLGKLTLAQLIEAANDERDAARARRCETYEHAARLLAARGDRDGAGELHVKSRQECSGSRAGA